MIRIFSNLLINQKLIFNMENFENPKNSKNQNKMKNTKMTTKNKPNSRFFGIYITSDWILGTSGIIFMLILRYYDLFMFNFTELSHYPRISLIIFFIIALIGLPSMIFLFQIVRMYFKKKRIKTYVKVFSLIWVTIFAIIGGAFLVIAIPNVPFLSYNSSPYLTWQNDQDPATDITVCWRTSGYTSSIVEYGTEIDNLDESANSEKYSSMHKVSINDLEPNTTYYYKIPSLKYIGIKEFTTAPTTATDMTFCVWSDPRTNNFVNPFGAFEGLVLQDYIMEDLAEENKKLDLSICTGDIVDVPFDPYSWKIWLNDIGRKDFASNSSNMVAIGNHERIMDTGGKTFRSYYPYEDFLYSFDYAQVHFVMIDTWDEEYEWFTDGNNALWDWLESDLQSSTSSTFTVLSLHSAPIYFGSIEGSWFRGHIFDKISSISKNYGIDVVFYGHQHNFEASLINGTYYMNMAIGGNLNQARDRPTGKSYTLETFSGTPGYCQVDVNATSMKLRPRLINGTDLNSYIITA